jgi:hypothetical protein
MGLEEERQTVAKEMHMKAEPCFPTTFLDWLDFQKPEP